MVAVPVTTVGVVLLIWGLALGDFTSSTVSGALIQFVDGEQEPELEEAPTNALAPAS
jgi:hypothetical protein